MLFMLNERCVSHMHYRRAHFIVIFISGRLKSCSWQRYNYYLFHSDMAWFLHTSPHSSSPISPISLPSVVYIPNFSYICAIYLNICNFRISVREADMYIIKLQLTEYLYIWISVLLEYLWGKPLYVYYKSTISRISIYLNICIFRISVREADM